MVSFAGNRCDISRESTDSHNGIGPAVSGVLDSLSSLKDSLTATTRSIEPRFVEIGASLQQVHALATELESDAETVAGTIGYRTEDGALGRIDQVAQKCLADIRQWQAGITESLAQVGSMASQLGSLLPAGAKLRKMAKQLRTMSVYFAVESSRSEESRRGFEAYTRELSELVDRIFEVTDSIRAASAEAEAKQTRAYACISEGADKVSELGSNAEASMVSAAREVDRIMGISTAAIEKMGSTSRNISEQISNIVVALQFHDITRQQIEHITEALSDVQQIGAGNEPNEELAGRVHSILALQVAQLCHVVASMEEAYQAISQNFAGIGESSKELVGDTLTTGTGEQHASETKERLAALESALVMLSQSLRAGHDLSNQTRDTAEQASQATLTLSQHIDQVSEINADISIQALNAVVSSVRLQEKGQTLTVLAQEVTGFSKGCGELVGQVVDQLGEINRVSATLGERCCGGMGDSSDRGEMAAELDGIIESIAGLGDQFETSSTAILSKARGLQDAVSVTGARLDFLPDLIGRLNSFGQVLEEAVESLRPWIGEGVEIDAELAAKHLNRYTMQSERDVHRQLNGGQGSNEDADTRRSLPESETDDDLGDNVELF